MHRTYIVFTKNMYWNRSQREWGNIITPTSVPFHSHKKHSSSNMSRAKNWCFTLNNYTDDHIAHLRSLSDNDVVSYIVFGKEVAPTTNTPHLQGYISFKKLHRLNQVRSLLSGAHLTVARGTATQNREYCCKDGSFEEYGDLSKLRSKQGTRGDLDEFKDSVNAGITTMKELMEVHTEICAKYPRFVKEYINAQREVAPPEAHPLKEWQQELNNILSRPPNDRTIHFVVDKEGGKGKTWFAKYYCSLHEGEAQYMEMAKKSDMAYALDPKIRVLIVNCTRQQVEYMNYSFLESVKDGMIFSPKYESCTLRMNKCHVVVMMNQNPDESKLRDRKSVV